MGENLGETANTELGNAMEIEPIVEPTTEPVAETGKNILPTLIEIDGHLVDLSNYIKGRESENLSESNLSSNELIASIQEVKETVKLSNTIGLCIGFGIFLFIGLYFSYIVWRRM